MFIAEISLGGIVRIVNFNNHFREAVGRLYDLDPLEAIRKLAGMWEVSYTAAAEDVIFCGLVGHCRFMRQPVDFTVQDVSLWLETAQDEDIAPALKVFITSQIERPLFKLDKPDGAESAKKKSRRRGKT
jgi:hypothetical protein